MTRGVQGVAGCSWGSPGLGDRWRWPLSVLMEPCFYAGMSPPVSLFVNFTKEGRTCGRLRGLCRWDVGKGAQ